MRPVFRHLRGLLGARSVRRYTAVNPARGSVAGTEMANLYGMDREDGVMRRVCLGIVVMLVIGLSSRAAAQTAQQRAFIEQHPARETFLNNCARCHGAGLGGMMGPSFLDDEWRYEPGVEGVEKSIRSGHGRRGMPSFSKTLSDEQIASLAHYLANAHKPDPVLPGAGGEAGEGANDSGPAGLPGGEELTRSLLAFCTDSTGAVHFAMSADGSGFAALNGGDPVIKFEGTADQLGVPAPHLARTADGVFVLAMTDPRRPGSETGRTRGFILSTSEDLVTWSHHDVSLDDLGPRFGGASDVRVADLVRDGETERMLVVLSVRSDDGRGRLVSAPLNDDCSGLGREPGVLLDAPANAGILDAAIVEDGGRYRLLFTTDDGDAGLRMAVSDRISGVYEIADGRVARDVGVCERVSAWRRPGTDTFVLMYAGSDERTRTGGFLETTDFAAFEPIGSFGDGPLQVTGVGSPSYGTVIHLTTAEGERLRRAFPSD